MSSLFTGVGAPGVISRPSLGIVSLGLSRYAGDIRSIREPLEKAVGTVIHDRIAANFRGETAALQEDWADLEPSTVKDRRRQGYGGRSPKLQRTGELRREALSKKIWTFRGQEGFAYVSATAFTAAPYGPLHDAGYKNTPARPFLVVNEDDVEAIEEIIKDWLRKKAISRGLASGAFLSILSRARV